LKAAHLLLFYFYFSGCFPSNVLHTGKSGNLSLYYILFFNSVKTWLHPMSVYSFLRSVKIPP
jgi:hypothetical protein